MLKFLVDENVHYELIRYLRSKKFDIKLPTKGSSDTSIAKISKEEKRIVITNDKDFAKHTRRSVYAVILLQIPQSDYEVMVNSFSACTLKAKDYEGKLIVLEADGFEESVLDK